MALVIGPFGGASSAKGSVASNTYQGNPYGQLVRSRVVPVNPNTPRQVQTKVSLDIIQSRWATTLTQAQRDGWEDYASETPLPNKFGGTHLVPGRLHYIRSNQARLTQLGVILDDAPIIPGVPANRSLTFDTQQANGLEITAINPVVTAGAFLFVRLGLPVNPTRNFYKVPFRAAQNQPIQSGDTPPIVIRASAGIAVGQKYFAAWRYYDELGRVSGEVIDAVGVVV